MKSLKNIITYILCFLLISGTTLPPAFAGTETSQDLPSLYITLENGAEQSSITHDDYTAASYSLVGAEGFDDVVNQPLEIKGRGNSTWSMEKKPYTIKLESKTDVLGLGKAKKWNLLANYWDKTLMRNFLTLNLAAECGLDATPGCAFVNLYVNGNYCGNYLLTEKVETGSTRVNIDTGSGGVLWEIERPYRHSDCTYCHETASGVHLVYSEPEPEDTESEAMTALMQTNNAFLDELDASLSKGYDEYSKYIDVDSFINWYIVNEFVKNFDSAYITSTYCYRDAGGKLFMGPCWDYDTCMGNQNVLQGLSAEGFRVNASPWYCMLLDDEKFMELLRTRYTELREKGVFDDFINIIDTTKQQISASEAMDLQRWPNAMTNTDMRGGTDKYYSTFDQEVSYLKDWVIKRVNWIDTQWNNNAIQGYFPLMASANKTSSVTGISGNEGVNNNEAISNLFDGKTNTKYCVRFDSGGVTISFSTLEPTTITRYSFITANEDYSPVIPDTGYITCNRNPTRWEFSGSSDGTNYNLIDARTTNATNPLPIVRHASTQFSVSAPASYTHYVIHISDVNSNSDGYFQLSEIVFSQDDISDMLWVQNAVNNFTGEISALHLDEALNIVKKYNNLCKAKQYTVNKEVDYDTLALNVKGVTDSIKSGDVNFNGSIDAADALLALQGAVEKVTVTDGRLYAANVDRNETLTAADALLILQYSVNKITEFYTRVD